MYLTPFGVKLTIHRVVPILDSQASLEEKAKPVNLAGTASYYNLRYPCEGKKKKKFMGSLAPIKQKSEPQ
jgi:hypothetical protein